MKLILKTSHTLADALLQDDRFKMGGLMYRITSVEPNDYNAIVVHFHPITSMAPDNVLVVAQDTVFKIYNQK